jgi:hypothetical protein
MKDPAETFNERFVKAETPEELYEAIASTSTLRVIETLAWRVDEHAREAAVRIRENYNAKYKSLHLRLVPMNIPDIIVWCDEVSRIIREHEQQNGAGQPGETGGKAASGTRSKPMSKAKMMRALKIDSPKTLKAWLADKDPQRAGNRQTWTVCLDGLDPSTIAKLEKA